MNKIKHTYTKLQGIFPETFNHVCNFEYSGPQVVTVNFNNRCNKVLALRELMSRKKERIAHIDKHTAWVASKNE